MLLCEGWFTEASHNQGICAHVDLMRFEDGIAIVSLESSCVMHLSRVETEACSTGGEANYVKPFVKINYTLVNCCVR